jgi:hypothetical protein
VPSLEQIVRPFVVVDTTPGVSVPPSSGASATQPNIVMRIGYGGAAKLLTTSWSTSFTGYMDGKQKETQSS